MLRLWFQTINSIRYKRERQRERDTDRHTYIQTDRQTESDDEMEYFFELMKDVAAMVSNDQLYQV
jgi:hypothetical protein